MGPRRGVIPRRGVPAEAILICRTYREAAEAVLAGRAAAFASVARAHGAFVAREGGIPLSVVPVGAEEREAACGCFGFGFGGADEALRGAVDAALASHLGSPEHRTLMRRFGFADAEIDLVTSRTPRLSG